MTFENVLLYSNALAQRQDDQHAEARELLRSQLLRMRDKVSQLVSQIPVDCKDLTVHDVRHLDALWASAQQVAGSEWDLNPAEAFVFGAAILVHDAGLTAASYPQGRQGLKMTTLWRDAIATRTTNEGDNSGELQDGEIDSDKENAALFEVLRGLHAQQAEKLCTQSWEINGGGTFYLIEDGELREAFGEMIGRIAGSHHWGIERVSSELSNRVGGSPQLPPDWTVNECKLGCLIRCADAAQVDRTRAPLLLYAALGPRGLSGHHWRAQSKLNLPVLKEDAIYFSSSSSFQESDADAWWITYDLANILDKELKSSNAVLTDIGAKTLAAQRVTGAEAPATFAKHVRPNGWKPIDATIRVTDPLKLARTLGGRNLYGSSPLIPFREMLQNAADAIRARRALERRGQDFGQISIIIEQHPSEKDKCYIHIDDNGIGMSERVLSTTLVDFGKSLWTSGIIKEEFPGLKAAAIRHIGKFGIGFFSVFEISDEVKVVSRRYDAGATDVRVMDFRGLISRPLLREGKSGELPLDVSTRISLSVPKNVVQDLMRSDEADIDNFGERYNLRPSMRRRKFHLRQAVMRLCAFLDIRVRFSDLRNGDTSDHTPDIYEKAAETLISELQISQEEAELGTYFSPLERLEPIRSRNGDSFGRAALDIDQIIDRRMHQRCFASVGGIVSSSSRDISFTLNGVRIPTFGVIEAMTDRAARDVFKAIADEETIRSWLTSQVKHVDTDVLRTSETMKIASFALSVTSEDSGLPIAFHGGSLKTSLEISRHIKTSRFIYFPLGWRYDSYPEMLGYNSLKLEYFEARLGENVIVLGAGSSRLMPEEDAKQIKKDGGGLIPRSNVLESSEELSSFIRLVEGEWGAEAAFSIGTEPIFSTKIASLSKDKWVLIAKRT